MTSERRPGGDWGTGMRPRDPGGRPTLSGTGAAGTAPTAAQTAHSRALGGVARPVPKPGPKFDPRTAFEAVQIRHDSRTCRDLTRSSKKEWLLTNGLGG